MMVIQKCLCSQILCRTSSRCQNIAFVSNPQRQFFMQSLPPLRNFFIEYHGKQLKITKFGRSQTITNSRFYSSITINFHDLPYRAEYARSGRACCKHCLEKIEEDDLRLAVMVQSPVSDNKAPHWYHLQCFFKKQRPRSVDEISRFESLKWDDQEKIRERIDGFVGFSSSNGTSNKEITQKQLEKNMSSREFLIDYAKKKTKCRGCQEMIIKVKKIIGYRKNFQNSM